MVCQEGPRSITCQRCVHLGILEVWQVLVLMIVMSLSNALLYCQCLHGNSNVAIVGKGSNTEYRVV